MPSLPKSNLKYSFYNSLSEEVWFSVYFSQQRNDVVVFLTFRGANLADMIYEKLLCDKNNIIKELGDQVEWISKEGKHTIISTRHYQDVKMLNLEKK